MSRDYPYGEAPPNYYNYLLELQKKHGYRVTHVSERPYKGIYIGKGSKWANPWRGSKTVKERVDNIYNFHMLLKSGFFEPESPFYYRIIYDNFYNNSQLVCYCNFGTCNPDPERFCHGLILVEAFGKALDLGMEEDLEHVFSNR